MRINPILAPAIALVGLILGCSQSENEPHHHHEEEQDVIEHIIVSSQALQENHIKSRRMELEYLSAEIKATGTVEADPTRVFSIVPRVSGWIKTIYGRPGQKVQRGDLLAEIHSPEFMAAQQEYLNLVSGSLASQADQRLRWLGLTSHDLSLIRSNQTVMEYYPLRASAAGSVTAMERSVGDYVDANQSLGTITDVSTVWVTARFQEQALMNIHLPAQAIMQTSAWPGSSFAGRLNLIEEVIDPETRTIKGRIEIQNPDRKLKLGMFMTIHIQSVDPAAKPALYVPEEAVQWLDGVPFVFVCENDTTFIKRDIDPGKTRHGRIEIKAGLKAGDIIIIEGSFLLKSEMMKNSLEGHDHAE